ncbi:MAG: D-alanyl-D-alanine carboxypeptidase family protein [Anaerovoracaceae bacterium]|jgi:D-alanyl-D-alanine carboxypeptidase (penicillin-binding protein 5/6)
MGNRYARLFTALVAAFTFIIIATCCPIPAESFAESTEFQALNGPAAVTPPDVSAQSAIVIEQTTGKVLYEKNSRQLAYPASTTKIVTALLAIEAGDLDRTFRVPGAAAGVEGSSIYLAAGEKISLRDLVYGLMLRSGNDAAVAISCLIDRSTEAFVQRMNERVQAMGAMDTHFMNPSGLFDENHYTTAYDMAIIAREAMKNSEFKAIAGAKSWVANRGEGKYNHFYNKNKVVFEYPGGTGIKIGYTKRSGRTLVASSERNGMELICVVMNALNWFNDSYRLMDYAFESFEMSKIIEGQRTLKAIPVNAGNKDHVFVGPKDPVMLPVRKGETESLEVVYRLPANVRAPIRRWQEAGALELYVSGEYLCSYPLYFLEDIDSVALR